MKSGFLNDIIQTEDVKLRIIGKEPSGSVKAGQIARLYLQVETTGITCDDVIVVARGTGQSGWNEKGRIYAFGVSDTPIFGKCLSDITLTLENGVRADSVFDLEVYESGYTREEIQAGKTSGWFGDDPIVPLAVLREQILWNAPIDEKKLGTIEEAAKAVSSSFSNATQGVTNAFSSLDSMLTKVLIIGGVGAALYFGAPYIPLLKKKLSPKR